MSLKNSLVFNRNNSRIDFGQLMFEAAKLGDWEGLELILCQEGASDYIDWKDKDGKTPLVVAVKNNNLKCVKTLLAHGCDLHVTVKDRHGGKEKHVWDMAAAKGYRMTTAYLNGCVDDLLKYQYHRAMMEADVIEICQNKEVTSTDLAEFDRFLNILQTCSTFDINGDEISDSLLIVATKADNMVIVKKLLETYKATPYANDLKTGESALHIACKLLSPLRFYLTRFCRDLIFSIDLLGEQPLHVACKMNDVEYVTWLFQRVLEKMEKSIPLDSPAFTSLRPSLISECLSVKLLTRNSEPSLYTSLNTSEFIHRQLPLHEIEEKEDICAPEERDDLYSPVEYPNGVSLGERGLSSVAIEESYSTEQVTITEQETTLSKHTHSFSIFRKRKSVKKQKSIGVETSIAKDTLVKETTPTQSLTKDHTPLINCTIRSSTVSSGYQTLDASYEEKPHPSDMPYPPLLSPKPCPPDMPHPLLSNPKPHPPLESSNNTVTTSNRNSFELSLAFIESVSGILNEMTSSHGSSPFTLDTLLSVHMRLFSVSTTGHSILHIIAREGYSELLNLIVQVAKYLEHNPDGADIKVLTRRDSSKCTPLEEAIDRNQDICLSILLEFAQEMTIFDTIYSDSSLLIRAVKNGYMECLKVLLQAGLWRGVDTCVKMVLKDKRLGQVFDQFLMFFYTQIQAAVCCSRVKRNDQVTIDTGVLRWDGIDLVELNPDWLQDAYIAIATVCHSLRVKTVLHPLEHNKELFVNLGGACNQYFESYRWQPQAHPTAWAGLPITEINLSSNKLESIPVELFQIETLLNLNLSKNSLVALPSNFDPLSPLYKCTSLLKLDLSNNRLSTLPEDLFFSVGNTLEELDAHSNSIEALPPGLWICTRLHSLNLSHNRLSSLHYFSDIKYYYDKEYSRCLINSMQMDHGVPVNIGKISEEEFMALMNYATRLNVFYYTVRNLFPSLIEETTTSYVLQQVIDIHWLRTKLNISQSTSLEHFELSLPTEEHCQLTQLDLSYNNFTEFPVDLACVTPRLEKLNMRGNGLKKLWLTKDMPSSIASIILSNNDIMSVDSRHDPHSCMCPVKLLDGYIMDSSTTQYCQHKGHSILDRLTNLILSDNKMCTFSCVLKDEEESVSSSSQRSFEKTTRKSLFPSLSVLSLERNNLSAVPEGIHHLTQLSSLSLSHNLNINYLPPEMGLLNPQVLLILKLEGIVPKNIDIKLLNKPGTRPLLTYLKSLYHKSQPYLRIKLMFIGNSNVGKTSLLLNLTKKGKVSRFKEVEKGLNKQPLSTVGVDLGDWEYSPTPFKPKVTFMTWDFGGQIEYYATHQCFLTQRSLYVIVWNAEMKEKGLESIKSWIDNIGGRIPKAPVIVVATHLDGLPSLRRNEEMKRLQTLFHKYYLSSSNLQASPDIYQKCFFVSCTDGTSISQLRDEIYEFALAVKPISMGGIRNKANESESLLRQPVPASYMKLQDIVREATSRFVHEKTPPILKTKEFRKLASEGNFPGKLDELEQATVFLHENGIMLHYDDPALCDLYFIDPQWLCTMLACVVTVQEKNPFQKNGFMEYSALQLVLRDERFPPSFLCDFVSLMQKFEVVILLDKERLLIPSLLPDSEDSSCVVFPLCVSLNSADSIENLTVETFAKISTLELRVHARYYLLPFVPNGFFPRLIARIISSQVAPFYSKYVKTTQSLNSIYNGIHWRCWRNGISLVHRHMEVIRIAPLSLPDLGTQGNIFVSSSYSKPRSLNEKLRHGIEIVVAILPDDLVDGDFLMGGAEGEELLVDDDSGELSHRLGVWLLRKLTEIIDSVFEDWYEGFARKKGFDYRSILQTSPCPSCLSTIFHLSNKDKRSSIRKTLSSAATSTRRPKALTPSTSVGSVEFSELKNNVPSLYLFTSSYCVVASSDEGFVSCTDHGLIPVSRVAPDLAFADFPSSMLFHKPKWNVKRLDDPLGSGGFGKVYKGLIEGPECQGISSKISQKDILHVLQGKDMTVAIKEFSSIVGKMEEDPLVAKELNSWDLYINGSREARMMLQLQHENILGLVGIAFQPLRLVLELAPLGDLKNVIKPFKREKEKLNRRTLMQLIYQVTNALNYIHSKHIIYRDLKPGNVLVWSFPEPKTQRNTHSTISIKLADYGISRHCTPEGAKGSEGTPAFLPPEVILHGGTAAFTTQLDVYSFGMFLYYLFTYLGPFENDKGRPISALLDEGKRPDMGPSQRPHALQMYELMCWCWSDNPQDRPTFSQILTILTTGGTFTQLLDSRKLTQEGESFTTACVHTVRQQLTRSRRKQEDTEKPSVASPSPSVLSVLAATDEDEEETMSVFYGTCNGKLGTIQFLSGENISYEVVDLLSCQITNIVSVGVTVWVSTWGRGITVYNAVNRKKLAIWGEEEGATIYRMLYVKESSLMVVLCATCVTVLETNIGAQEQPLLLSPKYTHTFPQTLTSGVVIMPHGRIDETEVWSCPMRGGAFKVLSNFNSRMFSVCDVHIPSSDVLTESCIQHIEAYEKDEESKLLVADGRFLQFWDVFKKEKERVDLDCYSLCKEVSREVDDSIISSLLVSNERIFIGTCGGIIVVMDTVTMDTIHIVRGYQHEVVSILTMSSAVRLKRFSRILSKREPLNSISENTSVLPELSSFSLGESSNSDRNIFLSLGRSYRSVVGGATNHPSAFIFPSSSSSSSSSSCSCCTSNYCSCGTDKLRSIVPHSNVNEGHLIFWSCEGTISYKPQKRNTLRRSRSRKVNSFIGNTILEHSSEMSSSTSSNTH